MKKIFLLTISSILLSNYCLEAQDIQVVGVGSKEYSGAQFASKDIISPVGGSKPSDYKIIDEPAYECIFDYIISLNDKNDQPIKENYTTILQIGKNAGRFLDYSNYRTDSLVFAKNTNEELWAKSAMDARSSEYKFTGDILLNYPEGELTYTDVVIPVYEEYTESFPAMEWQIEEEQDTICGYICTRATGSYGGRDWEVWFAEEIPSDLGPWKFSGLPGLIMAAKDSEGIHEFKAISFREGSTPIAKPNNPLIQKTGREKFIDKKSMVEKKPYSYINPDALREIRVIGGQVIVDGVEIPKRPNGYTPIELK